MARCTMCFQDKAGLQPPYPGVRALVCRGCFLQIDRVIGWLELAGVEGAQFTMPTDETHSDTVNPLDDAEPPKSPAEPSVDTGGAGKPRKKA